MPSIFRNASNAIPEPSLSELENVLAPELPKRLDQCECERRVAVAAEVNMALPRDVGAPCPMVAARAADNRELTFAIHAGRRNARSEDGSIGKNERMLLEAARLAVCHFARRVDPVIGGEKIACLAV